MSIDFAKFNTAVSEVIYPETNDFEDSGDACDLLRLPWVDAFARDAGTDATMENRVALWN